MYDSHVSVLWSTEVRVCLATPQDYPLRIVLQTGSVSDIGVFLLSVHAQVDAKYSVQFEDNTYAEGYAPPLPVPQRFVIPSKETRKART